MPIIREKWLKQGVCEACDGKGAVPVGLGWFARLDPLYWDVCPECNGEGVVYPVYRLSHLEAYDLRPRSPQEEEELREWAKAYREARQKAKLSPEEAKKVADLAVYGPLPFIPTPDHTNTREGKSAGKG
jgi:hypothetical protein